MGDIDASGSPSRSCEMSFEEWCGTEEAELPPPLPEMLEMAGPQPPAAVFSAILKYAASFYTE
jgi:hypothetical protein